MHDTFPQTDMSMTVTWGDSDPAGISYYPRSFDWFTNGRLDFLEQNGFPYMDYFHANGIALVCLHADCDYKKMVRPGERLTVQTSMTSFTRTRMVFAYRIFNQDGELAEEGETRHTYADTSGKPFNLKRRYPEFWEQLTAKWEPFNG